jgi:hypothetical protein
VGRSGSINGEIRIDRLPPVLYWGIFSWIYDYITKLACDKIRTRNGSSNHPFEELNGTRCAVVEKNVKPERVEFLKYILEGNGYTVIVVIVATKGAPFLKWKKEQNRLLL